MSPNTDSLADVGDVLRQPLASACRLTGFRSAAFFLFDPEARRLVLRREYHRDPRVAREIPGPVRALRPDCPDWTVLTEGRVLLERAAAPQAAAPQAGLWLPGDVQTGVGVRVRCGSGPLGTLWAFDRRRRELTAREWQVFDSVAAQCGGLLEREALARQWQESARIRFEVGTAAANMSADVLAAVRDRLPFDAAGFCTSCSEIGGDLCEVVPLSATRCAIAVGDASGHGVAAALVMHAARGALRGALDAAGPPADPVAILSQVNRVLCQVTPTHQFMSLLVGILDSDLQIFEYANAGHPCPLHVRDGRAGQLESHGLLTGVLAEAEYASSRVPLAAGDLLVFFSDGITEAAGRQARMVRSAGVAEAVLRGARGSAADVVRAVVGTLRPGGAAVSDDRTLLVIRMPH